MQHSSASPTFYFFIFLGGDIKTETLQNTRKSLEDYFQSFNLGY